MQRSTRSAGVGPQIFAGALAGLGAAWAMSEFQNNWVRVSGTKRKRRPRTDEEVMEEVLALVSRATGVPAMRGRDWRRAGILLHYGFGATVGALYGAAVSKSDLAGKGLGAPFGSALFILLDSLSPRKLKPFVNDSEKVSELYEWLTHVIYGMSLESGRRALSVLMDSVA